MQQKMDMRVGTWNVRWLSRAGSVKIVAKESEKCNLNLVAVQEVTCVKRCSQAAENYRFLWKWEC